MQTYLGTWQIAPSDGFWTGQDISESEAVVSAAVRAGIRGFDTARSYGKGKAEQTLSKILRRFPDIPFRVDTKIMPSAKDPGRA
ncbi:MAG: aldo/keto reductase, partial [Spirochaetales bacterium]|nr:aldo/keto reductase [Spirochaetales bacterium]